MKKIEILETINTIEDLEEKKISYSFYRAYDKVKKVGLERIDFEDLTSEKEYSEILENLERFEIKEFTISDQSTALMKALQFFKKEGYFPTDLVEQETGRKIWNIETNEEEQEIKPALILKRFK